MVVNYSMLSQKGKKAIKGNIKMKQKTRQTFMLLGLALIFFVGMAPLLGDEEMVGATHLTKLSEVEGIGEAVGVWIKSDGDIVVTGKNPEGLPSEVKAMGYSIVKGTTDEKTGVTTFTETWNESQVIDLEKVKSEGAVISGLSKGDMLKFFFSSNKTIKGLDKGNNLGVQMYADTQGNGKDFVDISLRTANPYGKGGMNNIHVFRVTTRGGVSGQPLPGSLGLMACGSALLWLFRKHRNKHRRS